MVRWYACYVTKNEVGDIFVEFGNEVGVDGFIVFVKLLV